MPGCTGHGPRPGRPPGGGSHSRERITQGEHSHTGLSRTTATRRSSGETQSALTGAPGQVGHGQGHAYRDCQCPLSGSQRKTNHSSRTHMERAACWERQVWGMVGHPQLLYTGSGTQGHTDDISEPEKRWRISPNWVLWGKIKYSRRLEKITSTRVLKVQTRNRRRVPGREPLPRQRRPAHGLGPSLPLHPMLTVVYDSWLVAAAATARCPSR